MVRFPAVPSRAQDGMAGSLDEEPVMGRWVVLSLVCLAAAVPEAQARDSTEQLLRTNGWHTSYTAARTAARASGKPMLLVFRCDP